MKIQSYRSAWPKSKAIYQQHYEKAMAESPNGHLRAREQDNGQKTTGKRAEEEVVSKMVAGRRWKQRHQTELDVNKWSVARAPLAASVS